MELLFSFSWLAYLFEDKELFLFPLSYPSNCKQLCKDNNTSQNPYLGEYQSRQWEMVFMNELLACCIVSFGIERHLIIQLNTMENVLIYLVVCLHSDGDWFKSVNTVISES